MSSENMIKTICIYKNQVLILYFGDKYVNSCHT